MQIYLIRHPQPEDAAGLCYGRLDVAVTQEAIAATVKSVRAQIPGQTLAGASVYCSPSARCLGLARYIASPREPTPTEDLLEMNFGHWQGVAWDAVSRDQIDAWAEDVWGYRPGGGESAEMVAVRWQRWLQGLRRIDDGGVVAVTHAGVIRVALARAGRLDGAASQLDGGAALCTPVPFGSVHRLNFAHGTCDVSAESSVRSSGAFESAAPYMV